MQLITYVTFAGNCEEALNFYKEVLDGEVLQISKMGEGSMEVPEQVKGKIMHARLKIGENVLYMSDTFDPASIIQGNNVSLSLQPETIAQTEDLFLISFLLAVQLKCHWKILSGAQDLACSQINLAFTG